MFGYVKVRRSDLRVREYEYYRAAYCGLCRSMGHCTGQCSRLALSYDVAFLALVRMALTGEAPRFSRRHCIAHPFHKRSMMERGEALTYSARVSAILTYEKCRDDVADRRGFGRLAARVRCLFFHGAYRRAKKHLADLAAIERERRPSADAPAAVFGNLLADVLSFGLAGGAARIAAQIGRQTGRFIYLADAIDDCEADAKSGNYNPILALYGARPEGEAREGLRDALLLCLSDLEAAWNLLDTTGDPDRRAVIENILYLGMPDAAQRVLFGHEKEEIGEQQPL